MLGIDKNGKLAESASVYPFVLNTEITISQYIDMIRSLYHEIAGINVGKRISASNGFFANFTSPVDIDEKEREFITAVAEQLEIELPDDFFDLGDLNKDPLSSNIFNGPKLNGSSEEIKKYRQIIKLHETISKASEWVPVEKAFSDMHCLRLAVQNCGRAIDEDVEISFEIPRKSLLTLNEFPQFENDEMGYLLNDCEMSVLFGIDGTAEYIEYSESERSVTPHYIQHSYGLPGYVPNYSDDFIAELNDIFCYSVYPSEGNYIVKLKVDYIKHNTSVAFPSILLVKDEIIEIPYKITSKNNPNVVEGVLKVQSFNA